jgi:hypothetical protein
MKCVIPESIFTWPRGKVDARSWDAALDVVQQSLLGMAVANDVNDEQDFGLTQVFKQCDELRAKRYLEIVPTNQELSKKYATSPRTVTNWRKRAVRSRMDNGLFLIGWQRGDTPRRVQKRSLLSN